QTVNNDFYKAKGGKTDYLGIDDGTRNLPSNYNGKGKFNLLTQAAKNEVGKRLNNNWIANKTSVTPNANLQINGGFNGNLFGKKVGGILGVSYNKSNKFVDRKNTYQDLNNGVFSKGYDYNDDRYTEEISLGALASFALQFDSKNKIALKSIINVNTNNYATRRDGVNTVNAQDVIGGEVVFKQNTFFTSQITGEHSILPTVKFKWYGAFNILDGFNPDQKRYQYTRNIGTQDPYLLLIGNSLAQESGSRTFQTLSDYIYTGGGDLSYTYNLFGNKQTVKAGYLLQIKDRLFDAQLFANFLPRDNPALRALPIDQIFAPQNFGNGTDTSKMFSFNSINNRNFRYIANTILNACFIQFDNQFGKKLRVVYGLRVEDYDQLLGSVKKFDNRFFNTKKTDYLPGINATYKLDSKTNIRLSGSQTVNRPEQRELSPFTIFDFELNASVQGNPNLERAKITNIDLRYELYPRSGEAFTVGAFYKEFKKPIEQNLQQGGAIFQYANADKANVYGGEAEFRKKLDIIDGLKNFTFQANVAYIYSKIKDAKSTTDRPLQGQSPYLLNFGLLYDLEKEGINATLLFNQIGKRIYIVGDLAIGGSGSVASIWEKERPVLDFQFSKKIIKNKAELKLNVSDIINQTQIFYQNSDTDTKYNAGTDAIRFSRKFGTTYSLSFNYSF
ncbi:MAG: outer membrane beta-barrel protein, partial [Deinococcales bacterium]|nr:outer membrane beta-barrel protein [Chitinophagaceae bacterium]